MSQRKDCTSCGAKKSINTNVASLMHQPINHKYSLLLGNCDCCGTTKTVATIKNGVIKVVLS